GFVNRYSGIRAVNLVEIDMVGLQAAQGSFALLDHVPAVVARGVGILIFHAPVHLRGQYYAISLPVALESLPYHLLAASAAVDVSGVEEVDSRVDGTVYDVQRSRFVRASSEHHASKAQLAYLGARASSASVVHRAP